MAILKHPTTPSKSARKPGSSAAARPAAPAPATRTPIKKLTMPRTPTTPITPRTPKTPGTLTEATQNKAETAQIKQWKADWDKWVADSQWEVDENYQQQLNTNEIHRTEAQNFYLLTSEELDTLPHWEFYNKHHPRFPGRSYAHDAVQMLVCRKFATQAGFHDKKLAEGQMLAEGRKLFEEYQKERAKTCPGLPRTPATVRLVGSGSHYFIMTSPRVTAGSWKTPVWEDGRVAGPNFQFDPCDYDPCDHDPFVDKGEDEYPDNRFRPIDSTTYIKKGE